MKTVQNLYDEMRSNDNVTVAMTVQDAISGLLKREALYRSTQLGDNVIDLIIDELRNAIGEGGAATMFAAMNILADPGARVGSLNPLQGATQLLLQMKTGKEASIAPEPAGEFNPPFGLVILNRGLRAVVISSYHTNGFTMSGGLFPEILTVTDSFPSGVLIYQGKDEVLPNGAFHCVDQLSYDKTLANATIIHFNENPSVAQALLNEALVLLESGNPGFLINDFKACSPRPNFTKPEEWPKISLLIREWLANNS